MAVLVSIVPFSINEFKQGIYPGAFEIPPAKSGDFEIFKIPATVQYIYAGDGRNIKVTMSDDEIAEAVTNDYNISQLAYSEDSKPGFFWIPGNPSKDEIKRSHSKELDEARQKQANWFKALVKLADDEWQKHRQHKMISDLQRKAAAFLRLDREWSVELGPEERNFCPACKSELVLNPAICKHCGCIIKPEEAKKFQFAKVG